MKKTYQIIKMDRPVWDKVEAVDLAHTQWLPETDISSNAQVCYNDQKIFIHMKAREKDIREELTGPCEMVCEDSCLEFFFAPLSEDDRYFNFEWNPKGTLYLGFGTGRILHSRQIIGNSEKIFAPKPYRTQDGWGIEFEIPIAFIRLYFPDFLPTGEAACNFYKCGDLTKVPHYMSWSPMTGDIPDFHRRNDFGKLLFI